jgi:hypothetical protein
MADEIHVMPGKHGCEVREPGTFEPVSAHDRPEDAVAAAAELAEREGADLVVHNPDGSVRQRTGPGETDPEVLAPGKEPSGPPSAE